MSTLTRTCPPLPTFSHTCASLHTNFGTCACVCLGLLCSFCLLVVSFMDCDDVMHPQRNEVVSKMFTKHKDLNSLLHAFIKVYGLRRHMRFDYNLFPRVDMSNEAGFELQWPYTALLRQRPIRNPVGVKWKYRRWRVNNPKTEPNFHNSDRYKWWVPERFKLTPKTKRVQNGHFSVRVSAVSDVLMPTARRGQDSIYNWRLLRLKKNMTMIPFELSCYMRPVEEDDGRPPSTQATMAMASNDLHVDASFPEGGARGIETGEIEEGRVEAIREGREGETEERRESGREGGRHGGARGIATGEIEEERRREGIREDRNEEGEMERGWMEEARGEESRDGREVDMKERRELIKNKGKYGGAKGIEKGGRGTWKSEMGRKGKEHGRVM
eukprot:GHVU01123865.1.p1 GENE.GHVU01123865.1~~GHVU01123865.1.p1  ORF type:complete len:384 (-),score=53.53 GHVU01123865.1:286-1437(-)